MKNTEQILTKVHGAPSWLDTWSKSQVAVLGAVVVVFGTMIVLTMERLTHEVKVNQSLRQELLQLKGGSDAPK